MIEETHKVLSLKHTLDAHTGEVSTAKFSPDGNTVVSAGDDKYIRLWSVLMGKETGKLDGHYRSLNKIVYSPDGKTLAGGGFDASIRLWSIEDKKIKRVLKGHTEPVKALAFNSDGTRLVSGSVDKTLRLWDITSGQQLRAVEGYSPTLISSIVNKIKKVDEDQFSHASTITSVAFSPDGKFVVSGSTDETVKTWSADNLRLIDTFKGHCHSVTAVKFSHDGKYMATGCIDDPIKLNGPQKGIPSNNKAVMLCSTSSRVCVRKLNTKSYDVHSISFSPDDTLIATGGWDYTPNRETIKLWDTKTGKLVRPLEGHLAVIKEVDFSPDGRLLVSCGDDRSVKIWNVD